ncbi:MAG: site-2 protease family protein [Acidobacteria bacterium]|nr:site-2 protease family protein [Acidobacteriota bacterium]
MLHFEDAILNVSLLWALTVPHEFAHAWAADRRGDDTPRRDGRLTLNPLAHVDWIGTVLLPAVTSLFGGGFLGWGRAVRTSPWKLRGGANGLALVALAGPASNIVFALVLGGGAALTAGAAPRVSELAAHALWLSVFLAIFNLLPVPPLDGSKLLLAARLPARAYEELARFGFLLILVAMTSTGLGRWMSNASFSVARGILGLFLA